MKNTQTAEPLPPVIGHWNKQFFPAEIRVAFEYFDAHDEPINPDKAGDSLEFSFKRKWKGRMAKAKAESPTVSFKSLAAAMILDMTEAWPDWEVEVMVAWAWKTFSVIKTPTLAKSPTDLSVGFE